MVKTCLLHCYALRTFYVTDGQNARDQIAFRASHSFLVEVQTNAGLHTCDACVITTLRLGLRAPLVARSNVRSYDRVLRLRVGQNKAFLSLNETKIVGRN